MAGNIKKLKHEIGAIRQMLKVVDDDGRIEVLRAWLKENIRLKNELEFLRGVDAI